ncbi:hypothetical protein QM565_11245 [Geitlerinema splendidum]|jgi:hypothetical protein|nr:hypothetical protein [Geitlerinema splendidum]
MENILIGIAMSKKLMFVLLMSGFIPSPKGAYAMDDEERAPNAFIFRPGSSRQQPDALSSIDKPVAPLSMRGMIVRSGERLHKEGDSFVNKAGTILLPPMGPFDKNDAFMPIVIENGEENSLRQELPLGGYDGGSLGAVYLQSKGKRMHISQFPGSGVWIGKHYVFRVNESAYGSVSIDAFPYTSASKVPSATPAPTL